MAGPEFHSYITQQHDQAIRDFIIKLKENPARSGPALVQSESDEVLSNSEGMNQLTEILMQLQ
jgi:hypothetical protein